MLDIPQKGVLDYNTYYNTDDQILSADVAMYLEVRGWEYNVKLCKAMLTDDFWAGGSMRGDNHNLEHLNEFTFDAEEDYVQSMFTTYYTLIYKANVILGHVSEEGATDMAKMARAEAKVFRAFAYFDLKTMWGNPPLVDHELSPSEYNVPNGTDEELWGLMEKDLTEAIASNALAQKTGVDDTATWRVTKQFAQALLGKVYLWQGKYAEAAKMFDEVVNSGKYRLMDDYSLIHRASHKHNCESVFESNRVHDDNNSFQNISMYALMTNWRMDKLEIDIIAQNDMVLHIVEVKTRSNDEFFDPMRSITRAKKQHMVNSANAYINYYGLQCEIQYDVIIRGCESHQ